MSCHTWCAYKVERTIEEARRLAIIEQKKLIKDWTEVVNNPKHDIRESQNWSQDFLEHHLAVFERQLRMMEGGFCNVAVMNRQPEHSYYIKDRGFFIDSKEFGNQFRIRNYPEDQIFSKEECLSFIEKNKDIIEFNDKTFEWIDEFWERYPDGYMHFG